MSYVVDSTPFALELRKELPTDSAEETQFGTTVQAVGYLAGFEKFALIQKSARTAPRPKDIGTEKDAVAVFDVEFSGLAYRIIGRLSHVVREGQIHKHIEVLVEDPAQLVQPLVVFQHEKSMGKDKGRLRVSFDNVNRIIFKLREGGAVSICITRVTDVEAHEGHALPPSFLELFMDQGNLAG